MSQTLKYSKNDEMKEALYEKNRHKTFLSGQYRIASLLMGLIFCLMGLVVSTIEPVKTCIFTHLKKLIFNVNKFFSTFN